MKKCEDEALGPIGVRKNVCNHPRRSIDEDGRTNRFAVVEPPDWQSLVAEVIGRSEARHDFRVQRLDRLVVRPTIIDEAFVTFFGAIDGAGAPQVGSKSFGDLLELCSGF